MSYPKPVKRRKKPIKIHKIIRQSVLERDNYTCQLTGAKGEQVHHIMLKSLGGNDSAMNLIVLSNKAHRMVHEDEKKWFKILFSMQKEHYPHLKKQDLKKK